MQNSEVRIVMCDDNETLLKDLQHMASRACSAYADTLRFNTRAYSSPVKLLEDGLEMTDILLLDVEMPIKDGFDVARELRSRGTDLKIIFLTVHRELVQEAFKVHAFRYLYKPFEYEQLAEALHDAITCILREEAVIVRDMNMKAEFLMQARDIVFIEALGEGSAVHAESGIYITNRTLYAWEDLLGPIFFRSHRTYLINLNRVERITRYSVTLTGGSKPCRVAQNKYAPLKDLLNKQIKSSSQLM